MENRFWWGRGVQHRVLRRLALRTPVSTRLLFLGSSSTEKEEEDRAVTLLLPQVRFSARA